MPDGHRSEQGGGGGRPPGRPGVGRAERDERGERAERDRVREPGDPRSTSARGCTPRRRRRRADAQPGAIPLASETGMVTTSITPAHGEVRRLTSPRTTGLSCRFTMVSRAASIASLLQPIERWPVRIVAATRRHPAGLRPADQATAVISAVTAVVGPGWQASARPLRVANGSGSPK